MDDETLTPDDIAAMRREGDYRAYLRQVGNAGRENLRTSVETWREAQAHAATPDMPPRPGHRPGAWPASILSTPKACSCKNCMSLPQNPMPSAEDLLRISAEMTGNPAA